MTIAFLSANLLCHDYRWVNGRTSAFQGAVSLNASMFVAVLLASRASSSLEVALLMGAAVQVFALGPRVYRRVKLVSEAAHACAATALVASALALTLHINQLLGAAFALVVLYISLVFPLTFVYIQRYKNKINGPWDEAVPTRRALRDYPA
jgi:phosphatidylinositol glycan class C protein